MVDSPLVDAERRLDATDEFIVFNVEHLGVRFCGCSV
jgi:hypothetical protein